MGHEKSCQAATSTPDCSVEMRRIHSDVSPDVSIIERTVSTPILVSDESIADLERSLLEDCMHIPRCAPNTCPGTTFRMDCPATTPFTTNPSHWSPGRSSMNTCEARIHKCIHKCPLTNEKYIALSSRPCSPKPCSGSPNQTTMDIGAGISKPCTPEASDENLRPRPCSPCPLQHTLKPTKRLVCEHRSPKKSASRCLLTSTSKKNLRPNCSIVEIPHGGTPKPVCCRSLKSEDCSVGPHTSCPPKSCPATPRSRACPASGPTNIPQKCPMSARPSISEVCTARPRSPPKPEPCDTKPSSVFSKLPASILSKVFQNTPKSPCTPKPCLRCPKSSITKVCPNKPDSPHSEICPARPRSSSPKLHISPSPSISEVCQNRPRSPCARKPCFSSPKTSDTEICQGSSKSPCSPKPCLLSASLCPKTLTSRPFLQDCPARPKSPCPPRLCSPKSSKTNVCPLKSRSPEPSRRCSFKSCQYSPAPSCSSISPECTVNPHCVQFQMPETSECGADVKELYFNKEVKKSDASVTWEQCLNEECLQAAESAAPDACPNVKTNPNHSGCKFLEESGADTSSGGTCDAARANYYHSKLLSTLQILQNKDETMRVQTESLNVAEQRIATLTIRAAQMRRELDRKNNDLQSFRKSMNTCCSLKPTSDASVQTHELEMQKNLVKTLQDNLSVIEELYRDCFYETAKQEELIDMLRKSYLDVRLIEKEKSDQIGRLKNVIDSQKWSLKRCQDIAVEVDDLKLEITNFLCNSNNDSGMWERSEVSECLATEVTEDLQDIMEQLVQLRDMLIGDCTCGLKEENRKLTQMNETMKMEMGDLKQRAFQMEGALCERDKDCKLLRKQLEEREDKLRCVQQQLTALDQGEKDRANMCDCLTLQLKQTQVILQEKCDEMEQLRDRNAAHAQCEAELREQLAQADHIIKENCKIRSEVQYLTKQVSLWRQQLDESEARVRCVEHELMCAREHCRDIDECYRDKAACVADLQTQLETAHARGAELCGEARRVVCAVRAWVRRMRARDTEQEDKIKDQEMLIACLKHRLQASPCSPEPSPCSPDPNPCSPDLNPCFPDSDPCCYQTGQSDTSPVSAKRKIGCSKCTRNENGNTIGARNIGCSKCAKNEDVTTPSCSKFIRRKKRERSGSETASCRHAGSGSERPSRKKSCDSRCSRMSSREASIQAPQRSEAGTCSFPGPASCRQYQVRHARLVASPTRPVSPSEELFERVERLQEAVEDGQRRWSRSQLHRR